MKIGILILIFLAAVLVSSLVMNKGTDDQTISFRGADIADGIGHCR